ncbi:MAG: hypothetical protein K8I02_06380 [Candidatus Methylomirabilis sp.]|nr:hypothetical protein [Deltaproteobacteria bacterium]
MNHGYTYEAVLAASEKVKWRVEDLIGGERRLDFSKPFLPESLARVEELAFLTVEERRLLNQIRGHGYLYTFVLVEEFILPFVLDHARPQLHGESDRVRALLGFAQEEAKHIDLFKRFRAAFLRGFETPCEAIGPPAEIARHVLSHHPLAVALTILHVEWMTQRHYLDSVRGDEGLDPRFKSLLKHHWMEEAQHARLDTLMVEALADAGGAREIDAAVEQYLAIGGFLDEGLKQQAAFDLASLERAAGRALSEAERAVFLERQRQALRWTFLGSGMTHGSFLATVGALSPAARARVEAVAANLC